MIWKRPPSVSTMVEITVAGPSRPMTEAESLPAGKPCTTAWSTRSETICVPATPVRKSASNSASTRFCSGSPEAL